MQKELLELELKYGVCDVELPRDDDGLKVNRAKSQTTKQNEPKQVDVLSPEKSMDQSVEDLSPVIKSEK